MFLILEKKLEKAIKRHGLDRHHEIRLWKKLGEGARNNLIETRGGRLPITYKNEYILAALHEKESLSDILREKGLLVKAIKALMGRP